MCVTFLMNTQTTLTSCPFALCLSQGFTSDGFAFLKAASSIWDSDKAVYSLKLQLFCGGLSPSRVLTSVFSFPKAILISHFDISQSI